MHATFPPCPHLPSCDEAMDWRNFSSHHHDRGPNFYRTALKYGQYLWQRGFPARAILCLDRAFGADLRGDEAIVREWPLPYAGMAWVLAHIPPDKMVGNPRVHFQHYADRLSHPRRDVRRWRAWACWALTCEVLPALPGDPKHIVDEPTREIIATRLEEHGQPGEAALWQSVMDHWAIRPK